MIPAAVFSVSELSATDEEANSRPLIIPNGEVIETRSVWRIQYKHCTHTHTHDTVYTEVADFKEMRNMCKDHKHVVSLEHVYFK